MVDRSDISESDPFFLFLCPSASNFPSSRRLVCTFNSFFHLQAVPSIHEHRNLKIAPYAVEVYPTFCFIVLEVKAREPVSQQRAPTEVTKTFTKLTSVLDKFESVDLTSAIGKELPNANIAEWLQAPNPDELIRDLAATSIFLHH